MVGLLAEVSPSLIGALKEACENVGIRATDRLSAAHDASHYRLTPQAVVVPKDAGYRDASRGYGLADFVTTRPGALPRASAELGLHVLEIMLAVHAAADSGATVAVGSPPERPIPVPLGDAPGGLRS